MQLEHVNLTVTDLDRSIAFYCDLLDAHVRWKGETAVGGMSAHVGDDNHYLALYEAPDATPPSRDYRQTGVNHFGFVVDDLDAARARVEALGAVIELEAEYEPGRRMYVLDPDGHELELVEY